MAVAFVCCSRYSLTKSLVVGSGRLSSETDKRGTKASSTPMNWKKEVLEIFNSKPQISVFEFLENFVVVGVT